MSPIRVLFTAICLLASAAHGVETPAAPLEGETYIHDPSTIIKEGSNYYVFGTQRGLGTKSSPDLIHWNNGDPVFDSTPPWVRRFVPDFRGSYWAPDIIRVNGQYLLYYAVSSFGKQTSAIGLAVSPTLDQNSTNYLWQDRGPVIFSTNGSDFNTIDPSVMLDGDGRLWLSFGSFWKGIFLTELDPHTGLQRARAPVRKLAWNTSVEASCLTRHGHFYYLFVNWGSCCRGTNSTYEVRVGRAKKITGPYLDQNGKDLAAGGGTLFLQTSGNFIGPGHIGILNDGSAKEPTLFSYHYYDALSAGRSRLAIGRIDWASGWPVAQD